MAAVLAAEPDPARSAAAVRRTGFQPDVGAAHRIHVRRRAAPALRLLPVSPLRAADGRPARARAGRARPLFPKARGAHPALLLLLPARQPAVSRAARAVRPVRRLPAGSFRTPDLHAHPVAAELHRLEVSRRALDAQRRGAVLPDFPAACPPVPALPAAVLGRALRAGAALHRAVCAHARRRRRPAAHQPAPGHARRIRKRHARGNCLVPPAQRPAEAPRAHAARRDAALRGLLRRHRLHAARRARPRGKRGRATG